MSDGEVLCVSRAACDRLCGPDVWSNGSEGVLQSLFARRETWAWLPRAETEDSPDWRQVVPVIVLREHETRRVLAYRRADDGTEARLAGRWSLTLGGHCDRARDEYRVGNPIYFARQSLINCLHRELAEEISVPERAWPDGTIGPMLLTIHSLDTEIVGLICSDLCEVDMAHLGWVWQGWLPKGTAVVPAADEIGEARWMEPPEIREACEAGTIDLESWGRILLMHLLRV